MKKLQDNRSADVRHDAQSKNSHPGHASSREQVYEAQDCASLHLPELFKSWRTYAWAGDLGSDAVDRQQEQSEENPSSKIGNAEYVPYAV